MEEERICENCRHAVPQYDGNYRCRVSGKTGLFEVDSCERFERRDENEKGN